MKHRSTEGKTSVIRPGDDLGTAGYGIHHETLIDGRLVMVLIERFPDPEDCRAAAYGWQAGDNWPVLTTAEPSTWHFRTRDWSPEINILNMLQPVLNELLAGAATEIAFA